MYRYDAIRPALRRRARRPVPRPDAPLSRRRADRGRVPAAAAAERPVHPALRADAARRDSVRPAVVDAAAHARAHRAATTTAATATSRTRQNIQFNWPQLEDVPDILAELARGRDARDPDQRQLHPQHHHRPFRRRRAATRSSIRGRTASCCGSGRRSIRSSRTCRASSRSRSPARRATAPRSCVHDIGLHAVRNDAGEVGFRVLGRRRPGPHADHRPRDPRVPAARRDAQLPRRDPARLQPLRPPRQQVQGAHQDPGQGAHARRCSRSEVEAEWEHLRGGPATVPDEEIARLAAFFAPPAVRALAGRRRRLPRGRRRQPRVRQLGRSATCIRTRCRATRS